MTRMTGQDCVLMCNLINTHIYIHTHTRTEKKSSLVLCTVPGTKEEVRGPVL